MINLRGISAEFQLRRQRKQATESARSFPRDLQSVRRILVCLPHGLRELTLVKTILPAVSQLWRSAEITLLAMPGVKVTDIYPRKGFHLITPTMDQITWAGLPRKPLQQSLIDQRFDLILDLNLEDSHFVSAVLLLFPDSIRVGRGNHRGRPYYNLEIKSQYLRDERNIYRSLVETVSALMNRQVDGPTLVSRL